MIDIKALGTTGGPFFLCMPYSRLSSYVGSTITLPGQGAVRSSRNTRQQNFGPGGVQLEVHYLW